MDRPLSVESELASSPARGDQASFVAKAKEWTVDRLHSRGAGGAEHTIPMYEPLGGIDERSSAAQFGAEVRMSDDQRNDRLTGGSDLVRRGGSAGGLEQRLDPDSRSGQACRGGCDLVGRLDFR